MSFNRTGEEVTFLFYFLSLSVGLSQSLSVSLRLWWARDGCGSGQRGEALIAFYSALRDWGKDVLIDCYA